MRKLLLTFLLIVTIFQIQTPKAFSGCICFDPIVMDIKTELKTAVMAAKDVISAAAELSFNASWFLELSLDTMANTAKRLAVKHIGQNITSWANGGFQGDPTFVVNPKVFFDNIETSGVRMGLREINELGGDLLSESLTNSIARNFRQDNASVEQKTVFTLGSTIQQNICDDANLSAMAKNAVNDVLNGTAYSAKKTELANSLCNGNASSDKDTQQAMVNVFKENFSTGGGWDSWLDLTTNPKNTAYGNTMAAKQAVAEKVEKKTELAKDEVETGKGYLDVKKCVKEVFLDTEGITACEEYETVTPGSLVASQVNEAVSGSFETLKQAQGFTDVAGEILGGMIDGIIGDFVNKGLSGMISSGNGGDSTGLNSNKSFTLTTGSYSKPDSETIFNQSTTLTDTEKSNSINKIIIELDNKMITINKLKNIDRSVYLSYLLNYENKVNALAAKYNVLVTEFSSYNQDILVTSGRAYIRERRTDIGLFRNKLIDDENNLDEAERLTKELKSTILATSDITEIQRLYQAYLEKVTDGLIPQTGSEEAVLIDYNSTKDALENDFLSTLDSKTLACDRVLKLERDKRDCFAKASFWEWTGLTCRYNYARECQSKGAPWAWSSNSCVDTTPVSDGG